MSMRNCVDEKSIFHTRQIRDTKTNVHLVLVFLCFISSLGVAALFAKKPTHFPTAKENNFLRNELRVDQRIQ